MKKKKLIFICIIILLIIGGCVQQLNSDSAFAGFTPAPVIEENVEDTSSDTDNNLIDNSNNSTQPDNSQNDGTAPDDSSLPAISGQEDNTQQDNTQRDINSTGNSENEILDNETLDNKALDNKALDNKASDETSELSELPEIPYDNRVYFANISEPGNDYKFSSGLYTEQDLRLLCLMLQLIPSDTVNGVLKAFDSSVTPDINLTQFTYAGFTDWRYIVNIDKEVTYYKEDGLAFLSIVRSLTGSSKSMEYILVFHETDDGFYTPSSVICINPTDRALQNSDRIIITNNEKKYLLTTGQTYDYINDMEILTRLYDCESGKLVFSLPNKVTSTIGDLNENYSVELKMETLKNYTDGFTISATTNAVHTVQDSYFAPNGIPLLFKQDITIFVSGASAYIEDGQAAFFANFAPIKKWQYKTVFKDALDGIKKSGAALEVEWAEDILNFNRNIPESSALPERKFDIFTYEDDDFAFDDNYKYPIHFTVDSLYSIVMSMTNKEHSSLIGVLENYLYGDNYDLSTLATLKSFKWSRIRDDVECKLVYPDIDMDYVILELEFAYRKNTQNVFLVFYEGYNHSVYELIDVQIAANMSEDFYYSMVDGLLKLNLPLAKYKDKGYSRYYYNNKLAMETLTVYTAPSGMSYNISLERDSIDSTLYYCSITAYLSTGIMAVEYELPICIKSDGVFTDDTEALKLLFGNPEEHEAFKLLLRDSLYKITKSSYYNIEYRTEAENVLKYFGWL